MGTEEGKKSDEDGGYDEYVRGAWRPERWGETSVVLSALRTLAPDSSRLKW